MIKIKSKRILAIIILILILFSNFNNFIYATEIKKANIIDRGQCEFNLQYWNEQTGAWHYIITHYATYNEGGK